MRSKPGTEPRGASLSGGVSLLPSLFLQTLSAAATRPLSPRAARCGSKHTPAAHACRLCGGQDPPIFIDAESLAAETGPRNLLRSGEAGAAGLPAAAAGAGCLGPGQPRSKPAFRGAEQRWGARPPAPDRGGAGRTRPSGRAGPAPAPPSRTSRRETGELHGRVAAAPPGHHRREQRNKSESHRDAKTRELE